MIQTDNKNFWEDRAEHFTGHTVSWYDVNMKKIEVNTIAKYLVNGDFVLDVGCSNGAATIELQKMTGSRFLGIDYSEKAIRQAKAIENENMKFMYKSILDFDVKSEFDKAISIRTIINLMNPADQRRAMEIICRALKPGGVYVMCEAFSGSLKKLNDARAMFDLEPLVMPVQNRYLDEDKIGQLCEGLFSIEEIVRHSSLYYMGTRVFQYMSMDNEPTGSDTDLHRFFGKYGYETKNSGDIGINKVYVLKKL